MSIWDAVQRLTSAQQEQICNNYEEFPIEVRICLADWLEQTIWSNSCDPPTFLNALLSQMQMKADSLLHDPHLVRIKLINAMRHFQQKYTANPKQLMDLIGKCIGFEYEMIHEAAKTTITNGISSVAQPQMMMEEEQTFPPVVNTSHGMRENLLQIKAQNANNGETLRNYESNLRSCHLRLSELQKLLEMIQLSQGQNGQPSHNAALEKNLIERKEKLEVQIREQAKTIANEQTVLENSISTTICHLSQVQMNVIHVLMEWKCEQQKGIAVTISLEQLQTWFEELGALAWTIRDHLNYLECLQNNHPILTRSAADDAINMNSVSQSHEQVMTLLKNLIMSGFVVEHQPVQVLKTGGRFPNPLVVRQLTAGSLNMHLSSPQVTMHVINEQQAKNIVTASNQNKSIDVSKNFETSGSLVNNLARMEFQNNQHFAKFQNVQLKKIIRGEKTGAASETVMDEKFCLFFHTEMSVGELKIKVWTMSKPIVVISHVSQEYQAWATISWHNAFSVHNIPFEVAHKVTRGQLAQMLLNTFATIVSRPLTEGNLQCLTDKAFNGRAKEHLTWEEFCKERMANRSFTFWSWFYHAIRLIEKHLKHHWEDGAIEGFISREEAESQLKIRPAGTFLLRFSDSEEGGITCAWHHTDGKVYNLTPYKSEDLRIQTMADKIKDLVQLEFVYPDLKPKREVFGIHYSKDPVMSESKANAHPYIKPIILTVIPGLQNGNINNGWPCSPADSTLSVSNPTTPRSSFDNHDVRSPNAQLLDDIDIPDWISDQNSVSGQMDSFIHNLITDAFPSSDDVEIAHL